MNKLEWCRANAPDAIKDVPDDELLEYMESAWEKFAPKESMQNEPIVSLKEINSNMDYMVLTLLQTFGNNLAFKGGYMLTKLIPNHARQTQDIDFSIQSSELYQSLINTMTEIGNKFVRDGIIASFKIKQTIEPHCSGGMDMYDANGTKILGIDVGWHDITFGTTKTSIDIGEVRAFEVERMLADKIAATLSRKRFRRSKDIYDIFCITNCFDADLNKIRRCLDIRNSDVAVNWENFPFNETIINELEKAYDKLILESIYSDTVLEKPKYSNVLGRFNALCLGVLNEEKVIWSSEDGMCK